MKFQPSLNLDFPTITENTLSMNADEHSAFYVGETQYPPTDLNAEVLTIIVKGKSYIYVYVGISWC